MREAHMLQVTSDDSQPSQIPSFDPMALVVKKGEPDLHDAADLLPRMISQASPKTPPAHLETTTAILQ